MEELTKIAGNVGFPIAVSIYLLVRIEGKLDHLADSIQKLTRTIGIILKEEG